MHRKVLLLATLIVLVLGIGCSSGSSPVVPGKDVQTNMADFFNSYDLSSPVVGEYTLTDYSGNIIAAGKIAKDENGEQYLTETRGLDGNGIPVDMTPLELLKVFVSYNNPAGTIQTGPNAGLPYYYLHQTVDYNINILSLVTYQIGVNNPPFSFSGPAAMTAEMHYAAFGINSEVIAGPLMPGAPIFNWTGVISPGYQFVNDTYYIPSGTIAGLDVTTVHIEAPIFLGIFDWVYFDGVAGIWDPIE